jgi:triacylglycerol lipase
MKLRSVTLTLSLITTLLVSAVSLPSQAGWFDWLFPASTYTKTKYPIVMIGGFMAFDDILGIDYFYRIPDELREDGATVIPVNLSAFNGSEARGLQLVKKLEELSRIYTVPKFNIIAHSGGATTARFAASIDSQHIASITSVHGGHKGLSLADWVMDVSNQLESSGTIGTSTRNLLADLFNLFGTAVEVLSGNKPKDFPQDAMAMLEDYTTEKSLAFNRDQPDAVPTSACGEGNHVVNGIRYYSWGGTSVFTNALDPLDYFFAVSSKFYGEANDGLIGRCSSHLGKVIRDDYAMNHVDAMNHIFGLHGIFTTDPITLYRQQANRLKNAGL